MAYIGQTEDIIQRLKSHDASKEFWNTAVVFISSKGSFHQAHIRWLEWKAIAIATSAQRYILDNGNAGIEPHVTESIRADVEEIFESCALLLNALGYPLIRPLIGQNATDIKENELELFLAGPEARVVFADWRDYYNNQRPHRSLGLLPPAQFAKQSLPAGPDSGRATPSLRRTPHSPTSTNQSRNYSHSDWTSL